MELQRKPKSAKRNPSKRFYQVPAINQSELTVAPAPTRVTTRKERRASTLNLKTPFKGIDELYAKQCMFPDSDIEPMDVPDDRCVMASTYRDVTTLDVLPDPNGDWMTIIRPSLVGFAAVTAGDSYTDPAGFYFQHFTTATGTATVDHFASPGPLINSTADHVMYPIAGPITPYVPMPYNINNTVTITLAAKSNIPYRYEGVIQLVNATTGTAVAAPVTYAVGTDGSYTAVLTSAAPTGIAIVVTPKYTVYTGLDIFTRIQTTNAIPNTYSHCLIHKNKSLSSAVQAYRVPSQSAWIQYQGSDLNNQGNIATARLPAAFIPSVSDNNSWYASMASLPFYAFETRAQFGGYAWALGDDISYYQFTQPTDLALDQPYIASAGSISTAPGTKMRLRITTIYTVISRDTSKTYKLSPVSLRFPLVRAWLAAQPGAMDNAKHVETVRKALSKLHRLLSSPEFASLARAAITAGTALAGIV